MITVTTETDRRQEAIRFIRMQIDEAERCIRDCDLEEDENGGWVYAPGGYPEEKRQFEREKRQWEIMLSIMTRKAPFAMADW